MIATQTQGKKAVIGTHFHIGFQIDEMSDGSFYIRNPEYTGEAGSTTRKYLTADNDMGIARAICESYSKQQRDKLINDLYRVTGIIVSLYSNLSEDCGEAQKHLYRMSAHERMKPIVNRLREGVAIEFLAREHMIGFYRFTVNMLFSNDEIMELAMKTRADVQKVISILEGGYA